MPASAPLCGRLLVLLLIVLASPRPAAAQGVPPLSDEAVISLVTIGPGDAVYSLWGHTAVRVYDPQLGIDWSYNYGTFDFGSPLTFIPRFARGELDYMLDVHSFPAALRHYESEGRPVIAQRLRLTPAQRQALFAFLQVNALPENREYRYDFLFDNCSTRVRDALETTLGDSLRLAEDEPTPLTFRTLIDAYTADQDLVDFGIDLALGAPLEERATRRELLFLPDYLLAAADSAAVRTADGWQPLVAETDTLFWVSVEARADVPWLTIGLWIVAGIALALTLRAQYQGIPPRKGPDVLFLTLVGFAGVVLLFLWFGTEHTTTRPNWNLLWAWPTHLVAAYALARPERPAWLATYLGFAAAGAAVTLLAWPLLPQALPPALVPILLLAVVRFGLRAGFGRRILPPAEKSTLAGGTNVQRRPTSP